MTVVAAIPGTGEPLVIGLPWDEFRGYMRWAWRPGMHMAAIGPTGEGKTTTIAGLLQDRHYVLALDPKGEDETLTASGFTRVSYLPDEPRAWRRQIRHLTHTAAREPACWDCIHNTIAEGGRVRQVSYLPAPRPRLVGQI